MPLDLDVPEQLHLEANEHLLLCQAPAPSGTKALLLPAAAQHPPVGTELLAENGLAELQVVGACRRPDPVPASSRASWLTIRQSCTLEPGRMPCREHRPGFSAAWITLSDKGASGSRQDTSGPSIPELIGRSLPLAFSRGFLLADDPLELKSLLVTLALEWRVDLVCTTGGTGVTSRDITPEATAAILERRLPGFEQAMAAASLKATPHAVLSRAVCGTLGRCLIINLPGSPGGVKDNLEAVLPALSHTLSKIHDDPRECHPL